MTAAEYQADEAIWCQIVNAAAEDSLEHALSSIYLVPTAVRVKLNRPLKCFWRLAGWSKYSCTQYYQSDLYIPRPWLNPPPPPPPPPPDTGHNICGLSEGLATATTDLFFWNPVYSLSVTVSEAPILTVPPLVTVRQGQAVTISVQFGGEGSAIQQVSWMKDAQRLPSDWTQKTAPGVFFITKESAVYNDAGNFTLALSITSFSNPLYKTATATTTLDVLGESRFCFYWESAPSRPWVVMTTQIRTVPVCACVFEFLCPVVRMLTLRSAHALFTSFEPHIMVCLSAGSAIVFLIAGRKVAFEAPLQFVGGLLVTWLLSVSDGLPWSLELANPLIMVLSKIDSGVPHWCAPGTVHERSVKELIWNWKDCWEGRKVAFEAPLLFVCGLLVTWLLSVPNALPWSLELANPLTMVLSKIDSGGPYWCTPGTVHERSVKE